MVLALDGRHGEAALRLGRIGFDRVVGYVQDPGGTLAELTDLVASGQRVAVDAMDDLTEGTLVLDVGNAGERKGARFIPGTVHGVHGCSTRSSPSR